MPLSDLPQPILFIIFLALFVLSGLYPAWKKLAAIIRKTLKQIEQPEKTATNIYAEAPSTAHKPPADLQLNDFELFILNRLAQSYGKSLTRKQINAGLHLEPQIVKTSLKSLLNKGLIYLQISSLFSLRYSLSETGHQYALEQGLITRLHNVGS